MEKQSKAKESKAKQSKAKQSKAKQSIAKQSKAKQNKIQSKTQQNTNKTKHPVVTLTLDSGVTGGGGQSAPETSDRKFLLTYREKIGKEKRKMG